MAVVAVEAHHALEKAHLNKDHRVEDSSDEEEVDEVEVIINHADDDDESQEGSESGENSDSSDEEEEAEHSGEEEEEAEEEDEEVEAHEAHIEHEQESGEEFEENMSSDEEEDNGSFHSPTGTGSRPSSPRPSIARALTPTPPTPAVPTHPEPETPSTETAAEQTPKAKQRMSATSLDDVDLVDAPKAESRPHSPTSISSVKSESAAQMVSPPPRKSSRLPWSSSMPPLTIPEKEKAVPAPAPAQPTRRGPFGWFGRASTNSIPTSAASTTTEKSTSSGGIFTGRRYTTSSTITNSSGSPSSATRGSHGSIQGLLTPSTQNFLIKPANGQDLIQQRIEATNSQHTETSQQEDAKLGADSLRANFRRIREAAGDVPSPKSAPESPQTTTVSKGLGIGAFLTRSLSRGETKSEEDLKKKAIAEAAAIVAATTTSGTETPKSGSTVIHSSAEGSPAPGSTTGALDDEIDWEFWSSVVEDYYSVATKSSQLLTRHIQGGIPSTIRGTVWQAMAQSKNESTEAVYKELIALPSTFTTAIPVTKPSWSVLPEAANSPGECKTISMLEKEIKKDMGQRTSFSNYKGFRQEGLMGLMKAYAVYDPEVGYVQGMAFLGAPLLLNMTEEEAFCLLVELMRTYSFRDMFTVGMRGLHLRLYQYDRLLEDVCPALSLHLLRRKADSKLYATQWFLTLFAYKFPLQLVLRVYDLAISEGIEAAILKFGIALMKKNEDALMKIGDLEQLLPFLREKLFDAYLDTSPNASSLKEAGFFGNGGEKEIYKANDLIRDACAVKITPEMLHQYTLEWVEKDKREMDELIEKETLRSQNAKLSAKLKIVEQELQQITQEHVQVATDLVHKKMENTQLQDENEGLKAEVDELKVIVDKQPKEVEDRLKEEMDKIMKRNLEVHTTNQSLEDQMREMEVELVGTKMNLAEVNESYDHLKTRWAELKRALE